MKNDRHDSLVQRQFGASAAGYRTSASHARGESLSRLLALASPQPSWVVLDAATGAGHTAAALAPHVDVVVAGDLTAEMLAQARIVTREKRTGNVLLVRESARALSYRAGVFDLVVCRVAAHHFPDAGAFVAESVRVLKKGGLLAIIDNVVPDDPGAAAWINDFERQRDPSHVRCLDITQWRGIYTRHGLTLEHAEVGSKRFDFEDWMQRMNVPRDTVKRLDGELFNAPAAVRDFWRPKREGGRVSLALQEAILIGRLPA